MGKIVVTIAVMVLLAAGGAIWLSPDARTVIAQALATAQGTPAKKPAGHGHDHAHEEHGPEGSTPAHGRADRQGEDRARAGRQGHARPAPKRARHDRAGLRPHRPRRRQGDRNGRRAAQATGRPGDQGRRDRRAGEPGSRRRQERLSRRAGALRPAEDAVRARADPVGAKDQRRAAVPAGAQCVQGIRAARQRFAAEAFGARPDRGGDRQPADAVSRPLFATRTSAPRSAD